MRKLASGATRARCAILLLRLLATFALIAFALLRPAQAQDDEDQPSAGPGEALSISLLTFGPGALYWERFGHNALLVRDASNGSALAYNYGMFDFNQKNFFLNFARGYMTYRVAADPLRYDLNLYRHEQRWVMEQQLALTPEQRVRLRDFLVWNTQPEHANYSYDYFLSNCSTRVRDALDRALDGALSLQLQGKPTTASYRFDAVRLIAPDRLLSMAMDLALGPTADRPVDLWAESFVPMVLMDAVQTVQIKDPQGKLRPLVSAQQRLLEGSVAEPPAQPPDDRLACLVVGLVFAVLLLGLVELRSHAAARIGFALIASLLALLSGIVGSIFAAIWGLTQHWAGWHNLNLLLFDPLSLLLVPALLMSLRASWQPSAFVRQLTRLIALGSVLALATYGLSHLQQNLHWILLMLPPQLALAFALRKQPQA
ncbi:MAG: hypothetical protein JWR16_1967 [Nevskia sp.]|nr:hypothetical protein [Nevskia sp.]